MDAEKNRIGVGRLVMAVLWPSFLTAILAVGLFFSLFDPQDLSIAGRSAELPRIAVYTLGFFCFWVLCALASLLSCYLLRGDEPPF